MNPKEQKPRLFTARFAAVCAAVFAAAYGLYILNAMVPLFVSDIGGDTADSGVLNTCFTVCACVSRMLGGSLADRFGRRHVIFGGGLLMAAGIAAYAAVRSFPLLMICRGIQGLGYAAMSTAASAAVVDVVPSSRLGEGIGISALAITLASCIAPTIGVSIATGFDYRAVFISTAAVSAAGMIYSVLSLHGLTTVRTEHPRRPLPEMAAGLFERRALPVAGVYCVFLTGSSMTYVYMTLFGVSQGFVRPGSFFIAAALAQVFARIAAGRWADRGHPIPVIAAGGAAGLAVYAGLALCPTEAMYVVCGAMFGLGQGLTAPVLNRMAVAGVPENRRGAASATFYLAADVGNGIGGMLWGFVIDRAGYHPAFVLASVWMLFSLCVSLAYLSVRRRGGLNTAKSE